MIKFELETLKENKGIGDLVVYKGQRVLKITFDEDDCFDGYDGTRLFLDGYRDPATAPSGVIYIYGTKLLALEKALKIERKGEADVNGNTDEG